MFYKLLGGVKSHDLLIVLSRNSSGIQAKAHMRHDIRVDELEQCFQRKRMSFTSLNRPIVEQGCIYNSSFFCVCVWSIGAIFQNLSPSVTLKMGSRSSKSNHFLSLSQQYGCTSLVKMHPFILEIECRKAIFQQSEPSCDIEK